MELVIHINMTLPYTPCFVLPWRVEDQLILCIFLLICLHHHLIFLKMVKLLFGEDPKYRAPRLCSFFPFSW